MSYSNGIITAPVSIYDVQRTLGSSSPDLGTLCKHANINKFARFKPVKYTSILPITDANRKSVAHGITIPDVVTSSSITGSAIMDAAGNDWDYEPPTGGSTYPYRLTDFANAEHPSSYGYYHNAVPPIQVNYPRDGWTFTRGTTQKSLVISIDLDPDDSAINLQANDFTATGLNLNQWKLIAYIDSSYFSTKIFASDDTILNGGEISGNTIVVNVPGGTGTYTANVYVCMYRYSSGRYEFLPLPKQGDYNPSVMKLKVIDDAQASGGGVPGDTTEEMFNNVEFSYSLYGTYKTAWESTDNGTAKWSMKSAGGLYVKMLLKNTGNTASTVDRAHFQLDLDGQGLVSATTMYNSSRSSVSSVTIASGGTATIYLYFSGIFTGIGSDWTSSNKNSSWSMDFQRNGATLFGGDIYAYYSQTEGWTQR